MHTSIAAPESLLHSLFRLALALLPSCVSTPPTQTEEAAPGQATFVLSAQCVFAFAPDEGAMPAVAAAAVRWSAATGCDVRVAPDGVPVISAPRWYGIDGVDEPITEPVIGSRSLCGRSIWDDARTGVVVIYLSLEEPTCTAEYGALHEMGHALTGRQGHARDGALAGGGQPGASDVITLGTLEAVCTGIPCEHMTPE